MIDHLARSKDIAVAFLTIQNSGANKVATDHILSLSFTLINL